jgi:hypothetical protein
VLILFVYLSPFVVAWFENEKISFSNIYNAGITLSLISLVRLNDEVANNRIFTGMYFFL